MKPDVLSYTDFRMYLSDLYDWLAETRKLSLRAFARLTRSSSPNLLQLVKEGKVRLKDDAVDAIAEAVQLRKTESEYLHLLNRFDAAGTHSERSRVYRELLKRRQFHAARPLTDDRFRFFSEWIIPAVRELVVHQSSGGDPAKIAKMIVPPVAPGRVEKAIELLKSLDLIRQTDRNEWVMTDAVISTPTEALSLALYQYYTDVIGLAAESIERFPSAERDLRGVTVGLSREGFADVKERLQAFWQELLEYLASQSHVDRVYQVNMQLFPLSTELTDDSSHA